MNFNFKKNNLIIILLLMFVILSCIVYFNMFNIKEGLTNISTAAIQNGLFLKSVKKKTGTDVNYNFYKLAPRLSDSHIFKIRNPISLTNPTYGTESRDFSMNDISYNTSDESVFSDLSFIEYHKQKGMFAFSDLSNARFYHYTNINIPVTINLDVSLNTAPKINNFNLMLKEFSGNIYEPSSNVMLTNLSINIFEIGETIPKKLVSNGEFIPIIRNDPPPPIIQTLSGNIATATATGGAGGAGGAGGSVTLGALGSLFGRGNPDLDSELFAYLLQNGAYGSSYVPPIYNNFETAMNLPSNPIVNPINSMNPLEYAETLFGQNTTPLMAKNSYLNQSSATTVESSANTMKAITSQTPTFDNNGNLLAQNSAGSDSDKTSTSVNNKKNIASEDYPPCPAPQRCPEPNFDCKKVPKYEQGPENAFLPRPVLTDFSTFGM
jgi:hypothetical protein